MKTHLLDTKWIPLYAEPIIEENKRWRSKQDEYEKNIQQLKIQQQQIEEDRKKINQTIECKVKVEVDKLKHEKEMLKMVKLRLDKKEQDLKTIQSKLDLLDIDTILYNSTTDLSDHPPQYD